MDNVKQQVVDRLKQANNILVTVRTDPSIDLLSSCIGLALVLDKLDKHATAVFSGEVPSAMEFLKPEDTLESTPNSLRDFIIALDKSKADKLRYKVEDKVVRIFITPYKTSLSQADLEFSQGDFNIDLVVALGVHDQAELDSAITEHGRILHDAAIISINNTPNGNLGSLNWQEISASSVSEMVADLAMSLDQNIFDEQIATSLLTGIVAETARFSNDKTTPKTMNIAGELMAAGANQQLVADKLRGETHDVPHDGESTGDKPVGDDGTLEITHPDDTEHADDKEKENEASPELDHGPESESEQSANQEVKEPELEEAAKAEPEAMPEPEHTTSREMLPMPELGEAAAGDAGTLVNNPFTGEFKDEETVGNDHGYLIDQAAEIAAGATGSTAGESARSTTIDLPPVVPPTTPILTHDQSMIPPLPDDTAIPAATFPAEPPSIASPLQDAPAASPVSIPGIPSASATDDSGQTLEDIEESVHSPHVSSDAQDDASAVTATPPAPSDAERIDDARAQVEAALKHVTEAPKPLESLGAHPFGEPLHTDAPAAQPAAAMPTPTPSSDIAVDEQGNISLAQSGLPATMPTDATAPPAMDMPLPASPIAQPQGQPDQYASPGAPPAVPPPFMPPMGPAGL